jgi:hypothetical protein
METASLVFAYSNDNRLNTEDLSAANCVIRMLSGGFCLAVVSKDGSVLSLNQYVFPQTLSAEEKIDAIADARQDFHSHCGKTFFQLYTAVNTQIPEVYYVENLNNAIADLLVNRPKDYVPVEKKIAGEPLYNLSLWEAVLLKKVKEKFPHCELKTTIGALLEKMAMRKPQTEALVFVEDMNFTILARNEKILLGCNSFAFETEADFLYYCLYFMRKIYANAETVPLVLCGNIMAESPLFTALKKYVANVELLKNNAVNVANYHYYCDIF